MNIIKSFFEELLQSLKVRNFSKQSYGRAIRYQLEGKSINLISNLEILVRNAGAYRGCKYIENHFAWQSIVEIDREYKFGLFIKYRGNKKLRLQLVKFLNCGCGECSLKSVEKK